MDIRGELFKDTYLPIKKLGEGGKGMVYLAKHIRLDRDVVLKVERKENPLSVTGTEVEVLKLLKHKYIPNVYDFFSEPDRTVTVMDFVSGESFDKVIGRGETFTQAQVIKWARQLLEALDYLHSPTHGEPPRGFVHSDIKPANIMRMPNGDICLIDFNISLALGDENVTGYTPDYASPEHFGLDLSGTGSISGAGTGKKVRGFDVGTRTGEKPKPDTETDYLSETETEVSPRLWRLSESSKSRKRIIPDVRSDIYCLGLTLYYLLTGRNPRISSDREPKSAEDFLLEPMPAAVSAPFADILTKAMQPDPEQRYQTAAEMLEAVNMLRYNDPRSRRLRRARAVTAAASCAVFAAGMFTAYVGMKRGDTEKTSAAHADESITLLRNGDRAGAVREALAGLPERNVLFAPEYLAKPQLALANAAGVYDLRGGFTDTARVKLPAIPSFVRLSPDGRTGAAVCGDTLAIFSCESGKVIKELEAYPSYLSEAEFIDNDTVAFAGNEGLTVYEISADRIRWVGEKATSVAVTGDGSRVAGVFREDTWATLYDAASGAESEIDFFGCYQPCPDETILLNGINKFELNADGTQLFAELYYEPAGSVCEMALDTAGGALPSIINKDSTEKTPAETVGVSTDAYESDGKYILLSDGKNVRIYSADGTPLTYSGGEGRTTVKNLCALRNGTAVYGNVSSDELQIVRYEMDESSLAAEYVPDFRHSETRISKDGKYIMQFGSSAFRILDERGNVVVEETPLPADVADPHYVRDDSGSYLEVICRDGRRVRYDGATGEIIGEEQGEPPDMETTGFNTSRYRIVSQFHGGAEVFDRISGKKLADLDKQDGDLCYVYEAGDRLLMHYVVKEDFSDSYIPFKGYLLDERFETVAEMDCLCDYDDSTGMLFFDYPEGRICKTRLYTADELIELAEKRLTNIDTSGDP